MYIHELASVLYLLHVLFLSPLRSTLFPSYVPCLHSFCNSICPLQMYSFDIFEDEQKIPLGMQVSVQPMSESVNTLGPGSV